MGRPRKRRRNEGEAHTADVDYWGSDYGIAGANMGDSQEARLNFYPQVQDVRLGMTGFHVDDAARAQAAQFAGRGFGKEDIQSGQFDFDFSQECGPDAMLGIPIVDSSQGFGQQNFDGLGNPVQLCSPSTTSNEDGSATAQSCHTGCACLPSLYTSLSGFQISTPPSFPYSMGALRLANKIAHEVVRCQNCAKAYNTALQNSAMLGTLINLVISEYGKLLKHIDERSVKEQKIAFRMGEQFSGSLGQHTGGPDCPMAINIDLDGEEWRTLARKAIAQEVIGDTDADQSLMQLLKEMKVRQILWHDSFSGEGAQGATNGHPHKGNGEEGSHRGICLQAIYIDNLGKSLRALNL